MSIIDVKAYMNKRTLKQLFEDNNKQLDFINGLVKTVSIRNKIIANKIKQEV